MEEEDNELEVCSSVVVRPRDWRKFCLNSYPELKTKVIDISKIFGFAALNPPEYFNQNLWHTELEKNELLPFMGYTPLSQAIEPGVTRHDRIGNRIQVKRISVNVKPIFNNTLPPLGNQSVTWYLFYSKNWRRRSNVKHDDVWVYDEKVETDLSNNPNVAGIYPVHRIGSWDRNLNPNTFDDMELLASKEFVLNDADMTYGTNVNIDHCFWSEHNRSWQVDIDVDFPITYVGNFVRDYNLFGGIACVAPDTSNVDSGMLFFTWAMDGYYYETNYDFRGTCAITYTDY